MRKFRKGLLAVLTAGLLATTAFGIAACGGDDQEQGDTPHGARIAQCIKWARGQ